MADHKDAQLSTATNKNLTKKKGKGKCKTQRKGKGKGKFKPRKGKGGGKKVGGKGKKNDNPKPNVKGKAKEKAVALTRRKPEVILHNGLLSASRGSARHLVSKKILRRPPSLSPRASLKRSTHQLSTIVSRMMMYLNRAGDRLEWFSHP